MSQATHKHTTPFLTTVRTLSNTERLAQWERRKRAEHDRLRDEQNYLMAWLAVMMVVALTVIIGQFFLPCLVVWTGLGIHCL